MEIIKVSKNDYSDIHKCWIDDQDNFVALIALTQMGEKKIPVFISQKCDVNGDIDDIMTIVSNPTPINISFIKINKNINEIKFPKITDNMTWPLVGASYKSKFYTIKAKIALDYRKDKFVIYDVLKITKFEAMNINFLQYIKLDRKQREGLRVRTH